MAFRIKHLDHVVLYVADLDRAVRFYCDVLGCTLERRVATIDLVQLRAGASMIDLLPAGAGSSASGRNMDHLALRIDPFDEPSLRAHLTQHGVEAGEVVSCYGAEGNGPSLYIKDPDGNTVGLKGAPDI
jgi:glyoxylase I family protein